MKTNPNDLNHGLTKLEHFAILIMQAKLTSKETEQGAIPSGQVKLLAQHAVHEANVLIDALNEYDYIVSESNKTRTYDAPSDFAGILGLLRHESVAQEQLEEEIASHIDLEDLESLQELPEETEKSE